MSPSEDWVTDRIVICDTPAPGANTVLYVNGDVSVWANLLGEYLAAGRTVAVVGDTAREVVSQHLSA